MVLTRHFSQDEVQWSLLGWWSRYVSWQRYDNTLSTGCHRMPISSLFCLTWRRRSRLAPSVRVSTKIGRISDPFPPSFLTQFRHLSADFRYAWNNLTGVNLESEDWLKLQAHFLSGNDDRAMDLLRREWGRMLNTNLSVQLTLLEGFTANGSLGYVYIVLYYEYTD